MSEPVYHTLIIFNPNNNVATAVTRCREELKNLHRIWDLSERTFSFDSYLEKRYGLFRFTTPWEPQLNLICRLSRQFPDCQFVLGFVGSVGTVLEQHVQFTIVNGVVLVFEAEDPGIPLRQSFHDVLDYCREYTDPPPLRAFASAALSQGCTVTTPDGEEITSATLAEPPVDTWTLKPEDTEKTVVVYSVWAIDNDKGTSVDLLDKLETKPVIVQE